nr:type II toxin-antitoxin system HicA family toxin [Mobiluncus mulieris]
MLGDITRHAKSINAQLTLKEGGAHTIVRLGDRQTVVPHHTEINEITARQIMKQLGMK